MIKVLADVGRGGVVGNDVLVGERSNAAAGQLSRDDPVMPPQF